MLSEVRQYLWLRLTVLGTGLAIVGSFVAAAMQLWPIVQRVIAPTKLACGCAVLSVTTPWWLTTISMIVIGLTMFLLAWLVALFIGHLRRSRNQELRLHQQPHETIVDAIQKMQVTIVEDTNPYAVTIGFWRPTIYLSRALVEQLTPDEYQAVLAHERAHQRACDPLVTAMMSICSSLLRFLPGARDWMSTAYSLRELAADAIATDGYQVTDALSSAFLKLSSAIFHPSLSAFSPNRDRLEKLLDHNWRRSGRWWHWSTGIIIIGVIAALLSFGHFASAKTPVVPSTAAAACHETIVMCQIQHLPALPSAWLCGDGRCVRTLESWSPFYAWTPVR